MPTFVEAFVFVMLVMSPLIAGLMRGDVRAAAEEEFAGWDAPVGEAR